MDEVERYQQLQTEVGLQKSRWYAGAQLLAVALSLFLVRRSEKQADMRAAHDAFISALTDDFTKRLADAREVRWAPARNTLMTLCVTWLMDACARGAHTGARRARGGEAGP